MKAIIPAAGLGTRFLPETKTQPKEMLLVVDRPAIQYIVEESLAAGADEVVIVNAPSKRAIEDHFAPDPELEQELRSRGKSACADAVAHAGNLPVTFAYQKRALGLGHAIHCAAPIIGEHPFIVSLGDVIVLNPCILKRMVAISAKHGGASVLAVIPVPHEQVHRFGIIDGINLGDGVWKISHMVEKPNVADAPTNLAIFGRYVLSPEVMRRLGSAKPGVGGEIQLTDTLDDVLRDEEMYALVIDPKEGFDIGTPVSWLESNIAIALHDPEMAAALRADIPKLL